MIVVGFGNGILFRENDGQLPSFDNTFVEDENFINTVINTECAQEFFAGDEIKIVVKCATGESPTMVFYDSNGLSGAVSGSLISSYTSFDFYEFTYTVGSAGTSYYFKLSNAGDNDWISEPITIVEDEGEHLLLEWFNLDPTTGRSNNNFEVDYSQGFTPFVRIHANLKDYQPKTEVKVYDNLEQVTKLKEKVQRTLELKTDAIPRWYAEKLVIASSHDNFYINETEYVREEKPEVNQLPSNLAEVSMILTQAVVKGLNTDDTGFDCDELMTCEVEKLVETGVSGNTSFTIPEGYLLQTITAIRQGGSNIQLDFGSTIGGDELGTLKPTTGAIEDTHKTLTKNIDYAPSGDRTLYVTVTGTSVDVDIHIILINNRS